MLFIPEEVLERSGLNGLAARLYEHLETAKIETRPYGPPRCRCKGHRQPLPAASTLDPLFIAVKGRPMERSPERVGGKQLGPTADRHVSGGFRLSGQRSRVAWLGVGVGSDGDHWDGVNVSPDGTRSTGPLPRGRINRIKLSFKISTTGGGGGCIDQSID